MSTVDLDVAIIGGGIAGLWLLARLRARNYRVLLIESSRLGAGQTICSQGIIHGGTKYALQGRITGAAQAIGRMPARWRRCLADAGEVGLSRVRVLSDSQYLWTSRSLISQLAGFFASHAMQSRMERLSVEEYPAVLRHADFHGSVYRLDEPVLDTASLLASLAERHRDVLLLSQAPVLSPSGALTLQAPQREPLVVRAGRVILTAGSGNAGLSSSPMQLRPLHMVLMRKEGLPAFYAHCLGNSDTPRLTITSHQDRGGRPVWYLGGQLAEAGVKLDRYRQIQAARRELAQLLPWLDLAGAKFATLRVERAEAKLPDGRRPDAPAIFQAGPLVTAWPTKLAMAPLLADAVLELLEHDGIRPSGSAVDGLGDWPRPLVAGYPWEAEDLEWS